MRIRIQNLTPSSVGIDTVGVLPPRKTLTLTVPDGEATVAALNAAVADGRIQYTALWDQEIATPVSTTYQFSYFGDMTALRLVVDASQFDDRRSDEGMLIDNDTMLPQRYVIPKDCTIKYATFSVQSMSTDPGAKLNAFLYRIRDGLVTMVGSAGIENNGQLRLFHQSEELALNSTELLESDILFVAMGSGTDLTGFRCPCLQLDTVSL